MVQERELLHLEMDNNRPSQIICEKEVKVKTVIQKLLSHLDRLEALLNETMQASSREGELQRMKDERERREQAFRAEINEGKMGCISEELKSARKMLDRERYAHEKTKEILQLKTGEARQLSLSLHRVRKELNDVIHENEELKRNFAQLQERSSKMERDLIDEINTLKRRLADELSNAEDSVELGRSTH